MAKQQTDRDCCDAAFNFNDKFAQEEGELRVFDGREVSLFPSLSTRPNIKVRRGALLLNEAIGPERKALL